MRRAHLTAISRACSAQNAYNPHSALESAFRFSSTLSVRRTSSTHRPGNVLRPLRKRIAAQAYLASETTASTNNDSRVRYTQPHENSTALAKGSASSTSWQRHIKHLAREAAILRRAEDEGQRPLDEAALAEQGKYFSYEGRYIMPPESPLEYDLPVPWAVNPATLRETSDREYSQDAIADLLLEEEVKRFVAHISPTPAEKFARAAVVAETQALIAKFAGADTFSEVYGSERTGLVQATSDLDIRLDCDVPSEQRFDELNERMRALQAGLIAADGYMLVKLRGGLYPILNFQHTATGIDVQVVAAKSTNPQDGMTRKYLTELPHLRNLYLFFRTLLGSRGLVDVWNGGIGSYGLFMMLVAALKRRRTIPANQQRETETLTAQLHHILDFYHVFNRNLYGLSILPPRPFRKHTFPPAARKILSASALRRQDPVRSAQWLVAYTRPEQPYLLSLQDPADPANDLGRKCHAIRHIYQTLKVIRQQIREDARAAARAYASEGNAWRGEEAGILLRTSGRLHEVYFERRERVERFGREIMRARGIDVPVEVGVVRMDVQAAGHRVRVPPEVRKEAVRPVKPAVQVKIPSFARAQVVAPKLLFEDL